ncbi:hypothetical protein C9374_003174 [Naegleria lovaniensis]|uniref:Transmembrane protein n=1 Tax=Naegleria lovaniensis TaxID=51637 RepID=A0AA88GSG5_NAELO|nr:uncharacterized protein C9374_003174 [Naegleria lovaniensis]KAG2386025.1 hypothetical protein C9374_003174 [Naegleria lovaniensis]
MSTKNLLGHLLMMIIFSSSLLISQFHNNNHCGLVSAASISKQQQQVLSPKTTSFFHNSLQNMKSFIFKPIISSHEQVAVIMSTTIDIFNSLDDSNSTHTKTISKDIRLQQLDPYPLSGISLGISVLFGLFFLGVLLFLIVFMMRTQVRNKMMKNQKIMLSLVMVLMIFECLGLLVRIIYDCISIHTVSKIVSHVEVTFGVEQAQIATQSMNSTVSAFDAGIPDANIIIMYLMGSFEVLTIIGNLCTISIIMTFVSFVFLKTVKLAGGSAFTPKQYQLLLWIVNGGGTFFASLIATCVVLVSMAYFVFKIRVIYDFQLPIFIVAYLIYVIQLLFQLVSFNIVSISVLKIIKQRSSQLNRKKSQTPLLKVIALQTGLTLCAFIQVVAMGCSAVMTEWVYMKLFYYFLNCLGILLFTTLILPLYHPLFMDTAKELKQLNTNNNEQQNSQSTTREQESSEMHLSPNGSKRKSLSVVELQSV